MRRFKGNLTPVATGPVRFGDEQPGMYVAANNCQGLKIAIESVLHIARPRTDLESLAVQALRRFAGSLDDIPKV